MFVSTSTIFASLNYCVQMRVIITDIDTGYNCIVVVDGNYPSPNGTLVCNLSPNFVLFVEEIFNENHYLRSCTIIKLIQL